jgi:hypothetical protein
MLAKLPPQGSPGAAEAMATASNRAAAALKASAQAGGRQQP